MILKVRLATATALMALAISSQPVSAQREIVQPLPSDGERDLSEALTRLARDATNVGALVDAGDAALELGDIDAAIGFFGRANELSPDNPRIKLGQARAMGLPLPPVLFELHDLFNSAPFLDFARRLTGDDRIAYVDAQPTRYLPGHFLNGHTDAHDDAGRLYAYVLNLSPRWRAEWGGLLMFLDGEGAVTETFTPSFGTLNLFRVPQDHAVSMVAPFAGAPRYSITGWWRTRPPGV